MNRILIYGLSAIGAFSGCTFGSCNSWYLKSNYSESDNFFMYVCERLISADRKDISDAVVEEKANDILKSSSSRGVKTCSIKKASLIRDHEGDMASLRVLCPHKISTERKIGESYLIHYDYENGDRFIFDN